MRGVVFAFFMLLAPGSEPATVIQSVTAIDPGSGVVLRQVDVLLRGERIQAIGVVAQPEEATVVDGRGRFLIPGLWDMHVHLWNPENQPELYIAYGVTGVRDMGSDFTRTRELRKSIEGGERVGPHILTSGPGVDGRESTDVRLPVVAAVTPDDGRRAADGAFDAGADFIKVFSSLGLEPYVALSERARQLRIPFAGHLPNAVRLETAIELRQASIEHFFGLERAGELRLRSAFQSAATAGTRFTPTLTMHRRELLLDAAVTARDPRMCLVAPAIRKDWQDPAAEWAKAGPEFQAKAGRTYSHLEEMVRWLGENQVAILAGSDTGDPYTVPGGSLQDELKLLAGAGLTPLEVLRTATSEPARYLGIDRVTGSMRAGMSADLVLLEADPLERVEHLSRIAGVWWKGRWFDTEAITHLKHCVN